MSSGRGRAARGAARLAVAALLAAGCGAPALHAAAPAESTPGRGRGGAVREAGIGVEARLEAWAWNPVGLREALTPVLIRIRNGGERPLRVRLPELELALPDGRRLAALVPYDLEGEATGFAASPYPAEGFRVAPHLRSRYPDHPVHRGEFPYEPDAYGTGAGAFGREALPTADMLLRALPEGVVAPGGRLAGFVYFERLPELSAGEHVRVRFRLVDAETGAPLGTAEIPFAAEEP